MDISGEVKAKREAAAQARRLAIALSDEADRRRVLTFAADLDRQADELEGRLKLAPPRQGVTQTQMQQQAAKATGEDSDDKGPTGA